MVCGPEGGHKAAVISHLLSKTNGKVVAPPAVTDRAPGKGEAPTDALQVRALTRWLGCQSELNEPMNDLSRNWWPGGEVLPAPFYNPLVRCESASKQFAQRHIQLNITRRS